MKKLLLVLLISTLSFSSCKTLSELKAFSKCEFHYKSVDEVRVAGIDVQYKKSLKDFTIIDAAKLIKAVAESQYILSLRVNLDVRNPNAVNAALSGGEWILFIDGREMLRGMVTQRVEVTANNGTAVLPMVMQVDLKKIFAKESAESIANFGLGLASKEGESTRVSLWIKPVFLIGSATIKYPDYIRLGKEF